MPLEKRIIEVPLGGGIDAKTDQKLVPKGRSVTLQNGEFSATGAINKRNGYTALSATGITAGRAMFGIGNKLLMHDGVRLLELPAPAATTFIPRGAKGQCAAVRATTHEPAGPPSSLSFPYLKTDGVSVSGANGIVGYGYIGYDGTNYTVFLGYLNSATDTEYTAAVAGGIGAVSSASIVRMATSGQYLFAVTSSGGNLSVATFDTLSPGWSNFTTVETDAGSDYKFDVCASGTSNTVIIAYQNTTPKIAIIKVLGTTVTAGPTLINESSDSGIAICATSTPAYFVAYMNHTTFDQRYHLVSSALTVTTSITVAIGAATDHFCGLDVPAGAISSRVVFYYSQIVAGVRTIRNTQLNRTTGALISGGTVYLRGARIVGKPFVENSPYVYLPVAYALTTTFDGASGYYLLSIDVSDATATYVIARVYQDAGINEPLYSASPPQPTSVANPATGIWWFGCPTVQSQDLIIDANNYLPIPGSAKLDFTVSPQAARLGKNIHVTGGILHETDGLNLFESGFLVPPENISGVQGAAGSLADGAYGFSVVYARFDAGGQLHRSAPSLPLTITVAAGGGTAKVTVTAPTLRLTNSPYLTRVLFYATDLAGSIFYEIGSVANDPTADTVSFAFTTVSGLTDNRILYTDGGVLENSAPPPLSSIVRKGNRLYGMAQDGLVCYTKEHVDGEAAAWVEAIMVKSLGVFGERHTLVEMDGNLVAIGERSISYMSGEGFDNLGTSDTLSPPTTVATDLGATAGTPTLTTAAGVFYKSPGGFCLLSRSLQAELIGAEVDTYKSLTTVSAVLVQNKNQVRFGHSDGLGVVYDYLLKQWSVFTNHTHAGAAYANGNYYFVKSNGQAYVQSTGFTDDSADVRMSVGTPWVHLGAVQGMQRVLMMGILGEWRSACTIRAKIYLDYDDLTIVDTITWDLSAGYVSGQPFQVRHRMGNLCKAIKVIIDDQSLSGTKESFSLAAVSFEIGIREGIFRLGTAQSA